MSEWQSCRLSQLADIRISNVDKKSRSGEKPIRLCNYMDVYSNDYIAGDLEFMESSASSVEHAKFRVDQGDVMITKDSESPYDIGIPSVVTHTIKDLVCGYHLALIKPNEGVVDSVFLAKQLESSGTTAYFSRVASGSTRYGLSTGAIADTEVTFPSLAKQRKIAAILQATDQAIEKTEVLIEKYQRIKAGLMHDLFTRGIGADGKLRPPREQAPELYQETPIGWIPNEWLVKSVSCLLNEKILIDIQDGNHGELHPKKIDFVDEGVPFIMASDIAAEFVDVENSYKISESQYESLRIGFSKPGDVLLSHKASIGFVAFVPEGISRLMLTPQVTYYRSANTAILSEYLCCFMRSPLFQLPLKSLAQQSTRDYIGILAQQKLNIAFPVDRDEQWSIASRANSMLDKIEAERGVLKNFFSIKAGLMHDLLTGKVQIATNSAGRPHV